jgi:acyl-CoA reductase-like NAD-dependent aldehyde dehydrogenase
MSLECSISTTSPEDVQTVISRSQDVFQSGVWSRASVFHRSDVLSRLARALEKRVPEFARLETLQTGRAIREMNAQLIRIPEWLYVLDNIDMIDSLTCRHLETTTPHCFARTKVTWLRPKVNF